MDRKTWLVVCLAGGLLVPLRSENANADAGRARIEYTCEAHEAVSGVVDLHVAPTLPNSNLSRYYEGDVRLDLPRPNHPVDGPPSQLPYGEFSFGVGKGRSLLERVLNLNRICFWSLAIRDRVLDQTDYLATAADSDRNCALLAPDGAEIKVMAQSAAVSVGNGSSFITAPPYYSCTLRLYLPK